MKKEIVMKKSIMMCAVIAIAVLMVGCDENVATTDKLQAQKTEMIQDRLNSKLGLPNITNGQEKRLMKELYELRDQADLVTYTYTYNNMTGEMRFLGKSIGFGIPASVQYSNPAKLVKPRIDNYLAMPQAEPNGLFMPEGLSATWVYLIDINKGKASPTYVEPLITVSLFPLPNAAYHSSGLQYEDLIK